MSATPTLLSRSGRRSGKGRGSENVNSLGKKDVGCAADGVVAETLDDTNSGMRAETTNFE